MPYIAIALYIIIFDYTIYMYINVIYNYITTLYIICASLKLLYVYI